MWVRTGIICVLLLLASLASGSGLDARPVMDGDSGAEDALIVRADQLTKTGGLDRYLEAVHLYEQALDQDPNNFEAAWKCARAHREYARAAKKAKVDDWEKICARHGKAGMKCAEQAQKLRPSEPDGYYYYGLCIGVYAEGIGVMTALAEGLRTKAQRSFEKVYELDKSYKGGQGILALARYWAGLPWPLKDSEKALKLCREYRRSEYYDDRPDAPILLAECLLELHRNESTEEARSLLREATRSPDEKVRHRAKRLLEKTD